MRTNENEIREILMGVIKRSVIAGFFVCWFGYVSNNISYKDTNRALNSGCSVESVRQVIDKNRKRILWGHDIGGLCHYLFAGIGEEVAFREYEGRNSHQYKPRKQDFC